jgi:predicted AAA+ superfamily ATPase
MMIMEPGTFARLFRIPTRSFFLFGPRGVGKTWLLGHQLGDANVLDLLDTSLQLELAKDPHSLEARVRARPKAAWIWIDEVQKVPALLDEVHRLMESAGWRFALSGSSARKLLRQGADLLAGRASTKRLEGLSFKELGPAFDLNHALEWGTLPLVVREADQAREILTSYFHTYIREEVREEGLVRKIEPFLRFLDIAGLLNGQQLNAENVARESGVPRKSVVSYFSILEDTLMGYRLPAYQPQAKVREQAHPKFYWFDSGVARAAANLLHQPVDATWRGTALETMIFHELRVYHRFVQTERPIAYYRTGSGVEVDFIVELERGTPARQALVVCLEVKHAKRWDRRWEAPMLALKDSGKVRIERMLGVYLGETPYRFGQVEVLPLPDFLEALFAGRLF